METGLFVGLLVFALGIFIGLPLCWVFLGSTLATLAIISGSTAFLAGTFYHAIDNYVLMAIAFFIFAGEHFILNCIKVFLGFFFLVVFSVEI